MCIAISKPQDKIIDEITLRRCWGIHKDGAGFSYVEDNQLVIKKGFMKLDDFLEAIKPYMGLQMLIHFRRSSPGMVVNETNCHPFLIESIEQDGVPPRFKFAIIHNGKLDWRNTETHSDTSCFVHDFLAPWLARDPSFMDDEVGMVAVERAVRYGTLMSHDKNKMVIMRHDSLENKTDTYILNHKAGNVNDGIWYSNEDWKYKEPVMPTHHMAYNPNPGITSPYFGKEYDSYRIPDEHGWLWVYGQDRWNNNITKQSAFELTGRVNPYGLAVYSNFNREEYIHWLKTTKGVTDAEITKLSMAGYIKKQPTEQQAELAPVIIIGPSDTKEAKKSSTTCCPTGLDHLDSEEIGKIVHEAIAMFRRAIREGDPDAPKKSDIRKMSQIEKVETMRTISRLYFPDCDALNDMEVDSWMLDQIAKGTFRRDVIWEETIEANRLKFEEADVRRETIKETALGFNE